MGKKTPLYSGGNKPTVTPLCPEESGSTAVPAVLPLATISGTTAAHRGTTAWPTAVLPRWEGGTTAKERYYGPPQPRPVP